MNDENDDWNGGGFGGGWLCKLSASVAAGIEQPASVSPYDGADDCAGTGESIEAYLTHLATRRHVSASTQSQR